MTDGRAAAFVGPGTGRIDDDVQLGYWMSQLPGLHVVTFRRYMAWHDRWKAGVMQMLPRLLLAHKVPWQEYVTLINASEALWHAAPHAVGRLLCDGPPCAGCAHVPSQRACAVDVELPTTSPLPPSCWPRCAFSKTLPPRGSHCWQLSAPWHSKYSGPTK